MALQTDVTREGHRDVSTGAHLIDPIAVAIRTRRPEEPPSGRFSETDPSPGLDVARNPLVAKILHDRKFQFLMILPNQIIFWLVIGIGLLGTVVPGCPVLRC